MPFVFHVPQKGCCLFGAILFSFLPLGTGIEEMELAELLAGQRGKGPVEGERGGRWGWNGELPTLTECQEANGTGVREGGVGE